MTSERRAETFSPPPPPLSPSSLPRIRSSSTQPVAFPTELCSSLSAPISPPQTTSQTTIQTIKLPDFPGGTTSDCLLSPPTTNPLSPPTINPLSPPPTMYPLSPPIIPTLSPPAHSSRARDDHPPPLTRMRSRERETKSQIRKKKSKSSMRTIAKTPPPEQITTISPPPQEIFTSSFPSTKTSSLGGKEISISLAETKNKFSSSSSVVFSPPPPPIVSPSSKSPHPSPLPPPLDSEEQKREKRLFNVKEFIQTEAEYVNDCKILVSDFWIPIYSSFPHLRKELDTIFSNIKQVASFHHNFLKSIQSHLDDSPKEAAKVLGSVLLENWPMQEMKDIYGIYCSKYSAALETVEQIQKVEPVKLNILECSTSPGARNIPLLAFLIKPVQRICKYPLLLRDLIQNTEECHADLPFLKKVAGEINLIVDAVNEEKRNFEKRQKKMEISSRLVNPFPELEDPDCIYEMEGTFLKLVVETNDSIDNIRSTYERKIFLFSSLIFWARESKKNRLQVEGWLFVSNVRIVEVSGHSDALDNSFELHNVRENAMEICLSAPSIDVKKNWVNRLKTLRKESLMQFMFEFSLIARARPTKQRRRNKKTRISFNVQKNGDNRGQISFSPASSICDSCFSFSCDGDEE